MDDSLSVNRIPDTSDYLPPRNRRPRDEKDGSTKKDDSDQQPPDSLDGTSDDSAARVNPDHLGPQVDLEV